MTTTIKGGDFHTDKISNKKIKNTITEDEGGQLRGRGEERERGERERKR